MCVKFQSRYTVDVSILRRFLPARVLAVQPHLGSRASVNCKDEDNFVVKPPLLGHTLANTPPFGLPQRQ